MSEIDDYVTEKDSFNIPLDRWELVKLRNIVELKIGVGFKQEEYTLYGAKLLQISNVSFGNIVWDKKIFLPEEYLRIYSDLVLKDGDIVMALNRPIISGGIKVAKISKLDEPSILYQRVGKFNFYNELMKPYIFYYFQSEMFVKNVESILRGVNQPFINKMKLLDIDIPIPSIEEQKYIVTKIEELLTELESGIEILVNIKKQLNVYKKLVTRDAFNGKLTEKWRENRSNRHYKDEKIAQGDVFDDILKCAELYEEYDIDKNNVPYGWRTEYLKMLVKDPIRDIVDGPFGSSLKASEYVKSGVPIIRLQNIERNEIVYENVKFVTDEKALSLERHSFITGDILITKLGTPLGKAAIVTEKIPNGIVISDIVRVRLNNECISKKFLVYLINSNFCINQFKLRTKGTTRPRINLGTVRDLIILIPPIEEQIKIVDILEQHFLFVNQISEIIEEAISKSYKLRKKILRDAFEGNLSSKEFSYLSKNTLLNELKELNKLREAYALKDNKGDVKYNMDIIANTSSQTEKNRSDLDEIIRTSQGLISPRELWKKSNLDIEEFYDLLKELIGNNKITQVRPNEKDVFLEANYENS